MTDIEKIVITAINLAKRFKHEYVTIEHLSAVILDDPEVQAMCYEVQADHEQLQIALVNYLEHECKELIKNKNSSPLTKPLSCPVSSPHAAKEIGKPVD